MHLLTGIWSADETDTTETIPTTLMPLLQEIAAPVHFPTLRKLCSVVVVGFSAFTSHGVILQGRCRWLLYHRRVTMDAAPLGCTIFTAYGPVRVFTLIHSHTY